MKFRKKPVVIEATQWFKNGDHPEDNCETFQGSDGKPFQGEGKVVRYFRHPAIPGTDVCRGVKSGSNEPIGCGRTFHEHGFIDTPEGAGQTVCPGDFVITGVKGERYPCKPDIFAATYEPVDSTAD
jgi:hypothetical protein